MPGFASGYVVAGFVLVQGQKRSLVPEEGIELADGSGRGSRLIRKSLYRK
jgi:hypothetical protein